jgi:hypothetical protein
MPQQGIVKGDTLQKISSIAFIIGAILFGVSGLLMPNAGKSTSDLHEMLSWVHMNSARRPLHCSWSLVSGRR